MPDDKLTGLDRWILSEFSKLEQAVMGSWKTQEEARDPNKQGAYDRYEFHVVYQKVSQFVAVELSAIYHDVIKDRLYTDPANSARRRSTQTTLHRLVTGLCQMLAPILAFTADEAWEFVPGTSRISVHESDWVSATKVIGEEERLAKREYFQLRDSVLLELEKARRAKIIGKSLEAKVVLDGTADTMSGIESSIAMLTEWFNVSQLIVASRPRPSGAGVVASAIGITVTHADGQKCERCWHWETDVGTNAEHPTLCGRCVRALAGV